MARGFAGGIVWGGVIVVAGLVTLSQLAPLPVGPGGQPEGQANQNAAPGTKGAEGQAKVTAPDPGAPKAGAVAGASTGGDQSANSQAGSDQAGSDQSANSQAGSDQAGGADTKLAQAGTGEAGGLGATTIAAGTGQTSTPAPVVTEPGAATPDGAPALPGSAVPQTAQTQTAQTQTAQAQTAQSQTAQTQTAQSQTAQSQTAQSEPSSPQSVEPQSVEPQSASPQSAEPESAKPESAATASPAPAAPAPATAQDGIAGAGGGTSTDLATNAADGQPPAVTSAPAEPDTASSTSGQGLPAQGVDPQPTSPEAAPASGADPQAEPAPPSGVAPPASGASASGASAEPAATDSPPPVQPAEPPAPQPAEPAPDAGLPALPDTPAAESEPPSLSALDQALAAPEPGAQPNPAPNPAPLGVTEAPDATGQSPKDGLLQQDSGLSEPTRLPQISEEPDPGLASQPLPQLNPSPDAAPSLAPEVAAIPKGPDPAKAPEPGLVPTEDGQAESAQPGAGDAQSGEGQAGDAQAGDAQPGAAASVPQDLPVVIAPDASGLPGKPATALPLAPGIDATPAVILPEGDPSVAVNELPQIGKSGEAVPLDPDTAPDDRPLVKYARPFDGAEGKPLFVILLRDVGAKGLPRAQLAQLPFPVSVVIDPLDPAAKEAAAAWVAAGQEVVMLGNGLPQGAKAEDVAQSFQAMGGILPQAVAVLDPSEAGFQDNRALSGLVVPEIGAEGRGLLTWDRGLNAADQIARRDGVPQALIYRVLDGAGESQSVMRRYLDRAAFKAGQEGQVVVIGDTRPETVEALLGWALEGKGATVALAPVSAVLLGEK